MKPEQSLHERLLQLEALAAIPRYYPDAHARNLAANGGEAMYFGTLGACKQLHNDFPCVLIGLKFELSTLCKDGQATLELSLDDGPRIALATVTKGSKYTNVELGGDNPIAPVALDADTQLGFWVSTQKFGPRNTDASVYPWVRYLFTPVGES